MDVNGAKHVLYLTDNSRNDLRGRHEHRRPPRRNQTRGRLPGHFRRRIERHALRIRLQLRPGQGNPPRPGAESRHRRTRRQQQSQRHRRPGRRRQRHRMLLRMGRRSQQLHETAGSLRRAPADHDRKNRHGGASRERSTRPTYHYRVVAKTATPGGVNFGLDEEITPHKVPALKTEAADEITRTTAKLHASYDGNGVATEYKFEWGLASEPGFTASSAFAPVPGGNPNDAHSPLVRSPRTCWRAKPTNSG